MAQDRPPMEFDPKQNPLYSNRPNNPVPARMSGQTMADQIAEALGTTLEEHFGDLAKTVGVQVGK